jgi:hypothetical protein
MKKLITLVFIVAALAVSAQKKKAKEQKVIWKTKSKRWKLN